MPSPVGWAKPKAKPNPLPMRTCKLGITAVLRSPSPACLLSPGSIQEDTVHEPCSQTVPVENQPGSWADLKAMLKAGILFHAILVPYSTRPKTSDRSTR